MKTRNAKQSISMAELFLRVALANILAIRTNMKCISAITEGKFSSKGQAPVIA